MGPTTMSQALTNMFKTLTRNMIEKVIFLRGRQWPRDVVGEGVWEGDVGVEHMGPTRKY